jgi:rhamnogalacturonan endolyase
MIKYTLKFLGLTITLSLFFSMSFAQRQMEYLNRGLVALNQGGGKVFISWRMLGTEPNDIAFNLYHKTGSKAAVKVNAKPITEATSYTQERVDSTIANSWYVKAVLNSKEEAPGNSYTLAARAPAQQYMTIPLKNPKGYISNDTSVGDLDGDGEYEIILHQTGRGRDNSSAGLTDPPVFQAYKLDGTLLWQINLGRNIREGAHYTQFMVFDLDGDGIAEFCCKTADGTIDGKGKVIGDSTKNYVNAQGKILSGPEFFTVFDGRTGAALATTDYIPARGNTGAWGGRGGNGGNDNSGNRVDRFTACVAYLDGVHPSVVMCRGYYGRTVLAAWDWRNGKLTSRWVFDSKDAANPYSGMGNHNLSVADVDGDGKDEIIFGAMCVDDNGKGLYTTGLRHGDALHVSDWDPSRPGLEVFGVHEIEENTKGAGLAFYDARTGEIIWDGAPDQDVGRGLTADIDPRSPGAESWGNVEGLRSAKGEKIGVAPRSYNFAAWWDGDLLRELLDGNRIMKWDYQNSKLNNLFVASGYQSNNGTKSTPTLSADLFGDWREEVILRAADNQSLRIYSTTIPTKYRFRTLMHDPQYRLSIAWQNVGYNQPPHTSFFLGEGMKAPVKPNIIITKAKR